MRRLLTWLDYWQRRRYEIRILKLMRLIMVKQTEIATSLDEATAQLQKVGTEYGALKQAFIDLQNAGVSENATPEVTAALERMRAQLQVVDDITPDAIPGAPDPAIPPVI